VVLLTEVHLWSVQLLALACSSIAAKMEESQIFPKSIDFKLYLSYMIYCQL